jgi:cytochrome P450
VLSARAEGKVSIPVSLSRQLEPLRTQEWDEILASARLSNGGVNRQQLAHILCSSCQVARDRNVLVIGSQAIYDEFCAILPSTIFLRLMGIPLDHLDYFLQNTDDLLRDIPGETINQREARYKAAGARCSDYFNRVLDERETSGTPDDDLLGRFMAAEVDGHSLTRENILDICFLLMIAGLDTGAASLSCIIAWLARHPEERRRVVADPDM